MPTVHPCCVLDGRCTPGADAHDLLLSEQTCSFITHNLESLFYSAWALVLLLTQKMEYVHFGSRWAESWGGTAKQLSLSLSPLLLKSSIYHFQEICFNCYLSQVPFFKMRLYFGCNLKKAAVTLFFVLFGRNSMYLWCRKVTAHKPKDDSWRVCVCVLLPVSCIQDKRLGRVFRGTSRQITHCFTDFCQVSDKRGAEKGWESFLTFTDIQSLVDLKHAN